jgi:hypothetical protein
MVVDVLTGLGEVESLLQQIGDETKDSDESS